MQRRWVTEYTGLDGEEYHGPQVLDESSLGAEAICSVLRGPDGQALRVVGELITWAHHPEENVSSVRVRPV